MLCIEHRVNTIEHLERVPTERGVEIDVRSEGDHLILAHDPFMPGVRLDEYLRHYRHSLLVFDAKIDGIVPPVLELLERHRVERYFFLNLSGPALVHCARRGIRDAALRYSEYEPIELALRFAGLLRWVWVDCFERLPLDAEVHCRLREHFELCLVSPELQRHPRSQIAAFREQLRGLPVDAVCSDHCDDWR